MTLDPTVRHDILARDWLPGLTVTYLEGEFAWQQWDLAVRLLDEPPAFDLRSSGFTYAERMNLKIA